MCKLCTIAVTTTGVGLSLSSGFTPLADLANTAKSTDSAFQQLRQFDTLSTTLAAVKPPTVKEPTWLTDQKKAEAAAKQAPVAASRLAGKQVVTYDVTTKGAISSSLAEFKQQANATLNDGRGWSRMGVSFQEVASGGQFTLVLSEASQVPSFAPGGCGAEYSCRAGRYVIINQDRWVGATPSWNSAGGSLRDYRHMVVNHETGHWLGHGHSNCIGAGQPAQVMQQQSISLQGCTFNAWPTASELWSTQLGIAL